MEFHFNMWLVYFYFYCICGWIFESCVVSIRTKKLTNRGFMKGPWLPIYGSGAIVILLATMPFAEHPVAVYFAGAIAATVLEYITGVLMLKLFKVRYWDYRYRKIQFQGHICLVSTITWGFLSVLMVYVVHRPVAEFIASWNPEVLSIFTFVVTICMVYDFTNAFRDAMDLRALITKAEEVAKQLNAALEEEKEEFAKRKEELTNSVTEKKEEVEAAVVRTKEQFDQYREEKKLQRDQYREERKVQRDQYLEEVKLQLDQYKEEKREQLEKAVKDYQEMHELNKAERSEALQRKIAALEEAKEQIGKGMESKAKRLLLQTPDSSMKGLEEESKAMRIRLLERRKSDKDERTKK